jgi:hypothetical protein
MTTNQRRSISIVVAGPSENISYTSVDASINKEFEVLALDIPVNLLLGVVPEPSQTRHMYTSSV